MPIELKHCFVFTGAPGTGKTSLLEALRRHGQRCVGEAGRAIIRQQLANRGDALPWANAEAFKTLMLEQALATWQAHRETAGPVFFDRGIVDVLGYARLSRLDEPPALREAANDLRYNRRVFIAPAWEAIYRNDAERRQDFAEALRTERAMREVYAESGYRLLELPRAGIAERLAFVLAHLGTD
ncbi:AAA family ATPase [Pseudomonas paraeruginosa]|uniref:AAA family ATPase n=1 Tax=Pseudomonas paraeruginosa TaxID=2994495 RepID=UPI003D28E4E7